MINFVIGILSFALGYFIGWLCLEYIPERKFLKQNKKNCQHLDDLDDEYYHHDEDYYRTHSDFVIIEKDTKNNDDTN